MTSLKSSFFLLILLLLFTIFLTEKRKYEGKKTLQAIEMLSNEIKPHYLTHADFTTAKEEFFSNTFEDFEDLLIVSSASRIKTSQFITNDKKLLQLNKFQNISILAP